MTNAALLYDLIEERAAIIEEGEQCSRAEAQNRAARLHGFQNWTHWRESSNDPKTLSERRG